MTFEIPSHWSVFVLDDTEERIAWFRSRLANLRFAKTCDEAVEILSAQQFDVVFLDHDLSWMDAGFPNRLHGNGKEVARYLARTKFPGKIVIHSRSDQAATMAKILPQATVTRFGEFEIAVIDSPAAKSRSVGAE